MMAESVRGGWMPGGADAWRGRSPAVGEGMCGVCGECGDAALLGCVLRGQVSGRRAEEVASSLVSEVGLEGLAELGETELSCLCGLGRGGARALRSAFELGRRLSARRGAPLPQVGTPASVADYVRGALSSPEQEEFHVLLLNSRLRVCRDVRVTVGLADRSLVHAREVYREAIRSSCTSIMLAHNHPSGEVRPSAEDIGVTASLAKAGEIIGIRLLDHVIVAGRLDGESPPYFSFRENGMLGRHAER